MRHSRVASAAHPPWVAPKRKGGGGATEGVEGNPTKGMRGGGAIGGVEGKPPRLDETRKESADRVARHQAD